MPDLASENFSPYSAPAATIVPQERKTVPLAFSRRALGMLRMCSGQSAEKMRHAFTHHPAQTDETYLQHLWFTTFTSLRFILISVLLFLHGLFPFTFTRTASKQIERIYVIMRARIPKSRRSEIDTACDYEI